MSARKLQQIASRYRKNKKYEYKRGVLKTNVDVSNWHGPRFNPLTKKLKAPRGKNRPAPVKIKASIGLAKIENVLQKKNFEGSPEMSACLKKIDHLCNHPRLKNISLASMNGFSKAFMVFNQGSSKYSSVYSGLKPTLNSTFYPDTSENPIERAKRNRELGGRGKAYYEPSSNKKGSKCTLSGKEHGEQVHRQLERITEFVIQHKSLDSCRHLFPDGLDPCVDAFLTLCEERSWFPLRSEYMIYDEDLRVATAVDMFVVDVNRWKLVKLEFKTGYETEEYGPHPNDTFFFPPLEEITNCPLNMHLLQGVVEGIILRVRMKIEPDEEYIVRMCPKAEQIELYSPAAWCRSEHYKMLIYETLMNRKKRKTVTNF